MGVMHSLWSWTQTRSHALAAAIWVTCLLLMLLAMTLNVLLITGYAPGGQMRPADLYYEPGFFALATFGALIVMRWPGHVMGWLFCLVGLIAMVSWPASTYEQFAGNKHLPMLSWVVWLAATLGLTHLLIMLLVVPFLFPSGHLLSRRWSPIVAISVITIVVIASGDAFAKPTIGNDTRIADGNPLYNATMAELLTQVIPLGYVILPATLIGAIAALWVRYRRSSGIERIQIRWLFWALSLVISLILLFLTLGVVAPSLVNTTDDRWNPLELVLGLAILIGISLGFPGVLGLAILRYRLYSIDLIVKRTLVYGALTLGLGATYWGGVVVLQQVLSPLTPSSKLSVAGSTLAVAALFQPLRRRVQDEVDRRFFRNQYDTAATIEEFGIHLRDAVDLDTLLLDLRDVVNDTMQPASVSMWIRVPRRGEVA